MGDLKPELLLPAGNTESFYAALEGGADAVYLGLRSFNARARAGNFSESYLLAALQEAHKRKVKLYVTLNTVIKNKEIDRLLDVLSFLEQAGVDAIIIQDWGLYYLVRRWFPKLTLHASTQMGNHNSAGVAFSRKKGMARVILARELTMKELEGIARKARTELELFVHGALCYSFSGLCLFSSYIGGRGANRGLCAQPCRMVYRDDGREKHLFGLKDNRQWQQLEQFRSLGIRSLKVEGRMKPADYVFRVAKAYRLAIDHPERKDEAEDLLRLDFGRDKTSYFLGKDIRDALAGSSNTGIPLGFVRQVSHSAVIFESDTVLKEGDRIRIRQARDNQTFHLRLQDLKITGNRYTFTCKAGETVHAGDEIFWVGRKAKALPGKFRKPPPVRFKSLSPGEKKRLRRELIMAGPVTKPRLFIRTDNPEWLPLIRMEDVDALILSFTRKELEGFDFSRQFVQQCRDRIYIELPKFISEERLHEYEVLLKKIEGQGINRFFISHLSQKLLTGKSGMVCSNENVYVYNDAAAKMLRDEQIRFFCYPAENDLENLCSMQNRQGIVLMHTYPELFYSRVPVAVSNADKQFADASGKIFSKHTKNGMTIVVPDIPVSLFQYKKQLLKAGFTNFMIDLNYHKPSKQTIKKILEKYRLGQQYQPSGVFNFKKGLQ